MQPQMAAFNGRVSFGKWIFLFALQKHMRNFHIPITTFFKISPLPGNHFAKPRIIIRISNASYFLSDVGITIFIHWVTDILPTFGMFNGILFHEFNRSPAIPCNIFKDNFCRYNVHVLFRSTIHYVNVDQLSFHRSVSPLNRSVTFVIPFP